MLQKQQGTRTQITDLAEIAVELSDREMRIVSGGILATVLACAVHSPPISGSLGSRSNTTNDGDHDTDWPQ
jgi:hypothetical protein